MEALLRILLADDDRDVRDAFASLLRAVPGVRVTGEACDGRDAVALALEQRPDVVLMDIMMPRMDGLEATREIARQAPAVRVIILTERREFSWVDRAFDAGARGFLVKSTAAFELEDALAAVARGGGFISAAVGPRVAHH